MTTSILDAKELERLLGETAPMDISASSPADEASLKPVSLNDLIDRLRGLLTPEEADSMERAINESCERLDD